jgi:hypothetical protein
MRHSCKTNAMIAKRKREEEKAKKESADRGISNYFTKGPVIAQPKAKVCTGNPESMCFTNKLCSLSKPKRTQIF